MRLQEFASVSLEPQDACPVCGAMIALAEIVPHPHQVGLEIQGFNCKCCGPVKSLVVKSRRMKERLS